MNKPIDKIKSDVEVRTHQRRIDGEPTQEILDYAKEHNIEIKEGHTIVREHTREMDKNVYGENNGVGGGIVIGETRDTQVILSGLSNIKVGKPIHEHKKDRAKAEESQAYKEMATSRNDEDEGKLSGNFMSGLTWTTDKED